MSPKWIRRWINDTIDRNRRSAGDDLAKIERLKTKPYQDMLASVIRVNIEGKRWNLKLTVNKLDWGSKKLNWKGA